MIHCWNRKYKTSLDLDFGMTKKNTCMLLCNVLTSDIFALQNIIKNHQHTSNGILLVSSLLCEFYVSDLRLHFPSKVLKEPLPQ